MNCILLHEDAPSAELDMNRAVELATKASKWPQTYLGTPLSKLPMDPTTVSEVLRLHLLSSGAAAGSRCAAWRYQQRGGYSARDEPALQLRRHNPRPLLALRAAHVTALPLEDKFTILQCLQNQILSYATVRDIVEEKLENYKAMKHELRMSHIQERKREAELLVAKAKLKKEAAAKKEEQKLTGDKAKAVDLELTRAIEKLTKEGEDKKAQYVKKSNQLQKDCFEYVSYLGSDRAYRRYWLNQCVAGLFVEAGAEPRGPCLDKPVLPAPPDEDTLTYVTKLFESDKERAGAEPRGPCLDKPVLPAPPDEDTLTYVTKLFESDKERGGSDKENDSGANSRGNSPKKPLAHLNGLTQKLCGLETNLQHMKELLMCTGDISTCYPHGSASRPQWWVLHSPEQVSALMTSLNKRGAREGELRHSLEVDLPRLLHYVKDAPLSALNPSVAPVNTTTEQVAALMTSLNKRGAREAELRHSLEVDLPRLLHYVKDAPLSALNPSVAPLQMASSVNATPEQVAALMTSLNKRGAREAELRHSLEVDLPRLLHYVKDAPLSALNPSVAPVSGGSDDVTEQVAALMTSLNKRGAREAELRHSLEVDLPRLLHYVKDAPLSALNPSVAPLQTASSVKATPEQAAALMTSLNKRGAREAELRHSLEVDLPRLLHYVKDAPLSALNPTVAPVNTTPEQVSALMTSLNKRGAREAELRHSLEVDLPRLLHYVKDAPLSALNPSVAPTVSLPSRLQTASSVNTTTEQVAALMTSLNRGRAAALAGGGPAALAALCEGRPAVGAESYCRTATNSILSQHHPRAGGGSDDVTEQEAELRHSLEVDLPRLLHYVKDAPLSALNPTVAPPPPVAPTRRNKFQPSLVVPPDCSVREALELSLRDYILELEEKIFHGCLGAVQVKTRAPLVSLVVPPDCSVREALELSLRDYILELEEKIFHGCLGAVQVKTKAPLVSLVVPPDCSVREALELSLRDYILELEEKIFHGCLGAVQVKDREAWRGTIMLRGYDKQADFLSWGPRKQFRDDCHLPNGVFKMPAEVDPANPIPENKYRDPGHYLSDRVNGVKLEPDTVKTEAPAGGVVRGLASALLQVEQGIHHKYLKRPLDPGNSPSDRVNGVKLEPDTVKTEAPAGGVVRGLASALLQVEQGIHHKYLKRPLGLDDKERKEREAKGKSLDMEALERWEVSLMECQSFAQICLHLFTLDSSVSWSASILNASCKICRRKTDPDNMLLCDHCNKGHHLYCLKPKLTKVPEGDWFCAQCKPKEQKTPRKRRKIFSDEELEEAMHEDSDSESESPAVCGTCGSGGELAAACSSCRAPHHAECLPPRASRRALCKQCTPARERRRCAETAITNIHEYTRALNAPRHDTSESDDSEDNTALVRLKTTRKSRNSKEPSPMVNGHSTTKKSRKSKEETNTSSRKSRTSGATTPVMNGHHEERKSNRRSSKGAASQPALHAAALQQLLKELLKHKDSWPFAEPVDVEEVPDYLSIISTPMDLSTMQSKLTSGGYESDAQFVADAALVFRNCYTYNRDTHPVARSAVRLEKYFNKRAAELELPTLPEMNFDEEAEAEAEAGSKRASSEEPPTAKRVKTK
ncbi:unnamed protein product [Plutella xylostella]|uniref:Bromodomain adjacent to zinc finger domain protein 1A n=1 Tax=Plutella xylostella TaxID=51655 RepID=A0A8S4FIA1_PLUXY|nr:unnamed protein product [Plutella xylostella]